MNTNAVDSSSTILLISNSGIRYEGQLDNIDAPGNTVSLRNVRIFGTEGRGNGVEVPPHSQIYDRIVFRGSDIKDLTLYDDKAQASSVDPAIVQITPKTYSAAARGGATAPQQQQRGFYDAAPAAGNQQGGRGRGGYGQHNNNNNRYQDRGNNGGGRYRGGYGGRGGRGGGGGGGYRRRQEHTGQELVVAEGREKVTFDEEFDFAKSAEEFEKKKNEFEKAKEEAKQHAKAYVKGSFFDNISSEKDKGQARIDREKLNRADAETFGNDAVNSHGRGGGYYRRGRGGRGRYSRRN